MTNPARAAVRYEALFQPADSGEWSLPQDVQTARATHARILNAISSYPAAPPDPSELLIAAALRADDPATLDISSLLDHQRTTTERDCRLKLLRTALERAAQGLTDAVHDNAHITITQHLRPAGDKLWNDIATAVTALGDRDPSDVSDMMRAPDKTRLAFIKLDDLAARYNRIRNAWSRVPAGTPEHDVRGEHNEFEIGIYAVWPDGKRVAHLPPATPPWPTGDGGKGRLIWLVRAGATPWIPTTGQRDDAWKKVNAEALERMKEQQLRHHQTRGWGRQTA